jgi:thiol-disulfide isomerase/thioredoxin
MLPRLLRLRRPTRLTQRARARALVGAALLCLLALSSTLGSTRVRAGQPDIYPAPEQAQPDLDAALKVAAKSHQHIILDFGGNWCPDCHALDIYFHEPENLPLLEKNYILVHVNIGRRDQNLDLAERYGIPLSKGVPALAVLDAHGKLLYGQQGGEFEDMRHMQADSVNAFLEQWKP